MKATRLFFTQPGRTARSLVPRQIAPGAAGQGGAAMVLLIVLLAAGCSLVTPRPANPTPDELRRETNRQFVQEFEERRTAAELLAAKNRYEQGDLPGCRIALERILQRAPDEREARLLMIGLELSEFHPEQARPHAEAILARLPDDPEANQAMGLILESCGQTAAAMAYYERAVLQAHSLVQTADGEGDPASYGSLIAATGENTRICTIAHHESVSDAVEDLPRSASRDLSKKPLGRAERPEDVKVSGTGPKPAGTNWAAYDENAEGSLIQELLAAVDESLRQGDCDTAWANVQEAAALNPHDPQIPTAAAVSALRHNQPELAVRMLSSAARQFPRSAPIHRTLGTAYYRLGDYKSSQLALQQALSLDKSSALTYLLLGCTLAKLGRPDAAEGCFRQARLMDPRYTIQR